MPLPNLIRRAPKNLNPPLNNPQCQAWPHTTPDTADLILYLIILTATSLILYNISIYLLAQRRAQNRQHHQDREANWESADEQHDIEHSRAKVRAWIEVNDTVAKPPSPIQIERPRFQCLVPTGLEADVGARVQRPRARRSESAPLLGGGSVDGELHFLYDTFDVEGRDGGEERGRRGRGRCGGRVEGGDGEGEGMSVALADVLESTGGVGIGTVAKKRVSFAAGDEAIESVEASWSTVLTVSEGEE